MHVDSSVFQRLLLKYIIIASIHSLKSSMIFKFWGEKKVFTEKSGIQLGFKPRTFRMLARCSYR